jgi:hypothetical protein
MKAVLKNGLIYPREPLPLDWEDGAEVDVEIVPSAAIDANGDLDRWIARVQASAEETEPDDERQLEDSIREIRRNSREFARKEAKDI